MSTHIVPQSVVPGPHDSPPSPPAPAMPPWPLPPTPCETLPPHPTAAVTTMTTAMQRRRVPNSDLLMIRTWLSKFPNSTYQMPHQNQWTCFPCATIRFAPQESRAKLDDTLEMTPISMWTCDTRHDHRRRPAIPDDPPSHVERKPGTTKSRARRHPATTRTTST